MLRDFGLSILPIVVRNTTNYVPIVQKILAVDPSAYKSARKILRMIKLVGSLKSINTKVSADDNSNDTGPVLSIIADAALEAADFDYCLSICDLMMERPSASACRVCLTLINNEGFADLAAKARLTSFCVNYCEDAQIEDMLQKRINLVEEGRRWFTFFVFLIAKPLMARS